MMGQVLAVALLVAGSAQAQYITLDRQNGDLIGAEIQLGFAIPDDGDVTATRADFYAQVTTGKYGGYVQLPFGFLSGDGDDEAAVGNLELGAIGDFGLKFGAIGLRVGVVLPTGSTDTFADIVTLAGALSSRITDAANFNGDYAGVRLSFSPRLDLGIFHGRIDLGFDALFYTGDPVEISFLGAKISVEPDNLKFIRMNVAMGVTLSAFTAGLELVNVGRVGAGSPDDLSDAFVHELTVTAGVTFPLIQALVGFTTPLDEDSRGELYVVQLAVRGHFSF